MIEKEQFSRAESRLKNELNRNSNDIVLNYSMSVLLSNEKYTDFNFEKAFNYIVKTRLLYNSMVDESKIRRLERVPINKKIISQVIDSVAYRALAIVKQQNKLEVYERYLSHYKDIPQTQKYINEAIKLRDIEAYRIAFEKNTLESFENFIQNYPNSAQINDARLRRNSLAFNNTKEIDNISAYKYFINKYPDAIQVKRAQGRIHEIAYSKAEKANTASSYKAFIKKYPESKQYNKAYELFEKRQFVEITQIGNCQSYKDFIKNYPENSLKKSAKDSLFNIGVHKRDKDILKYCINNFTGNVKNKALLFYYEIFTDDGEAITLDLFISKYNDPILNQVIKRDYQIAILGDRLNLNRPFKQNDFDKYDEYIRIAAPKEKAFVALQRMIAKDIKNKNWNAAIKTIKEYYEYFKTNTKKLDNLISILEAPWDNSVKINSVGGWVNTKDGSEYCPIISADGRTMYFCGRDRNDNIWGEDIFVSKLKRGFWNQAKLVSDLSFYGENNAPLSISNDGNTMIVFKSGDLYYAERTTSGWSKYKRFPDNINSGTWQADAMITSDGRALVFAAIREEGYNLHKQVGGIYHGDNLHQSDIYVSLLNENNQWGDPINLGSVINTKYTDRSPFMHPDMKTLYFSSDGHGGLGRMDVFKSTRLADTCWTCWSEPINLGKEINSVAGDWGYQISTDGTKAFFAKREIGGSDNIFYLDLPTHLRPDFVATISGKLIDKNNEPIYAEIRWEDLETGANIGQSRSNPEDGSFFIVLPLGRIYGYYIDKDDYFPISSNIDLRDNKKPVEIEEKIDMIQFKEMIEEGVAVPANNLFFNFAESTLLPFSIPELKRVAEIIKTNGLMVEISGHTDNIGSEENNLILSEKRAASVKNFLINEGCSPENITIIGYGMTMPVATNDTEKGRAKNRRVELKFINSN